MPKLNHYLMQTDMIMDTLVIQLTHEKALKLLLDLEDLHLIRVLKRNVSTGVKLSDKYAGKLPVEIGAELEQHIEQSRSEWESDFQKISGITFLDPHQI